MIRALIFDYGGVLMRTVNPLPRRQLEEQFNLPPGGVDRLVFESPLWDQAQLGHVSGADFWADVGQRLELSADELSKFRHIFWAGDRLDEELVALIRHLRDEGYLTLLLSNAPAGLRSHVEQLGIADAFDAMVISGEEGLMKPDRALFECAIDRADVAAEAAAFVDDSRANVVAARQTGLRASRFRGLVPLRQWLRELGVGISDSVLDPVPDVRAVIFDWGGVIEPLPDDDSIAAWERRLALADGALSGVLWGQLWQRLSLGISTQDDYVRSVGDLLGFPDLETTRRFFDEFYAGDRFYPEVVGAARTLRGRYQVALLSNAAPDQDVDIRERFGLDVYAEFDVYVNSAHVGLRKPDPAIFWRVIDQLDVAPEQAILLDDGLRNVDAARELGIHVVQFVDPATSLAELAALLGHPIG